MKNCVIIGGGTSTIVDSHLRLVGPGRGCTAISLYSMAIDMLAEMDIHLYLTRQCWPGNNGTHTIFSRTKERQYNLIDLDTNDDMVVLIDKLVHDSNTKVIIMNSGIADFTLNAGQSKADRLTSTETHNACLVPYPKIISQIRKHRKDIFLVAFKQTSGATEESQYLAGLNLLKSNSCNLVLANDKVSRLNMVITPEEAKYHVTTDRTEALTGLLDMVKLRSHLTFTKSTVIAGNPISWDSTEVFPALRAVVNYCIERGAYKPFRGATVGHFACKIGPNIFLTSIRKSNFNDIDKNGLVKIVTDGEDSVLAYGAKPSVGGQSQRIVFADHSEYDCIVHFHCPKKIGSSIPSISQREYECGSHECGQNTSRNLRRYGNLSCVYLDNHGPNIVFNHNIDPYEVIDFIEHNFDLEDKTGGPVTIKERFSVPSLIDSLQNSNSE